MISTLSETIRRDIATSRSHRIIRALSLEFLNQNSQDDYWFILIFSYPHENIRKRCKTSVYALLTWDTGDDRERVPLHRVNQSRFSQTSIALTAEGKVMKLQDYVKYLMCIFVVDLCGAIHCNGHVTDASLQVSICINLSIQASIDSFFCPYSYPRVICHRRVRRYCFLNADSRRIANLYFHARTNRDLLIRFIIREDWDKNAAFWICSLDGSEAAAPAVSNSCSKMIMKTI